MVMIRPWEAQALLNVTKRIHGKGLLGDHITVYTGYIDPKHPVHKYFVSYHSTDHSKWKLLKMVCENKPIMAIDPGTRSARFLPQGKRYNSIVRYTARQGLCLHTCAKSFDKALRLPWRGSQTAANME